MMTEGGLTHAKCTQHSVHGQNCPTQANMLSRCHVPFAALSWVNNGVRDASYAFTAAMIKDREQRSTAQLLFSNCCT